MSQETNTDQDLTTYDIQRVSCVQVPLWLPEHTFDFLKALYAEPDINMELQVMLLNAVRANLEEVSEFSPAAASIVKNTKKMINNLRDM